MSDLQFFSTEKITINLKDNRSTEVVKVSINNPPVNSLTMSVLHELLELLHVLQSEQVGVVIFTGIGKAFVAGADIKSMQSFNSKEAREFAQLGHRVFSYLETMDSVSIAAINGVALGGGLELALACDIRIALDTARLGLPEVSLGIIPGFGGTQRLTHMLGESVAKYHILTGQPISVDRALSLGLIQDVCSSLEELNKKTHDIASMLCHNGPSALTKAKFLIHSASSISLEQGSDLEISAFASLFESKQPYIGMTAFLEKKVAIYNESA